MSLNPLEVDTSSLGFQLTWGLSTLAFFFLATKFVKYVWSLRFVPAETGATMIAVEDEDDSETEDEETEETEASEEQQKD